MSAPVSRRTRRSSIPRLALLGVVCLLAGCARGCTSSRPPIHVNPNMDLQPRYNPQAASAFFYDGATMRQPVAGTVARGELRDGSPLWTGKDEAGAFVVASPVAVDDTVLAHGRRQFGIYCAPCHDPAGDGKGVLATRGKVPTPSLHDPRLRGLADGQLFDTISNGVGLMPAYRYPIPAHDRWAIVAHVRALQERRAALAAGTVTAQGTP